MTAFAAAPLVVGLLLQAATVLSQSPVGPVSDEQRRFLEVRRRQVELSAARADLDRARQLFEQKLLARTDYDRARVMVETASARMEKSCRLSELKRISSVPTVQPAEYSTARRFFRSSMVSEI